MLTEGIYRVPGNQIDVERMFLQQPQRSGRKGRGTNASGATPAVASIDYANIPVHALATGLKRFLDTLPEPLIPERVHLAVLSTLDPLINSTINVIEITNEANGHRDEQVGEKNQISLKKIEFEIQFSLCWFFLPLPNFFPLSFVPYASDR